MLFTSQKECLPRGCLLLDFFGSVLRYGALVILESLLCAAPLVHLLWTERHGKEQLGLLGPVNSVDQAGS